MREMLYWAVGQIARIHSYILGLNDAWEYSFNDKELHFLVVGVFGMAMIFVLYPVFKWLAKRQHEMVITWFYVFTVLVGLSFAIEIGQQITGTGTMDFGDIMFGMVGFLAMFLVFSVVRGVFRWIVRKLKAWNK